MIRAVFFDLDDTLLWDVRSVREALEATCKKASDMFPMEPGQLLEVFRAEARRLWESYETYPFTQNIGINPFEGLWARFDGGSLSEFRKLEAIAPEYRREAWYQTLKHWGVTDEQAAVELAETFVHERRSRRYLYEETIHTLEKLRKEYKLLLLTNGAPDLQEEKIKGVELAPYFDHIVISGQHGKGKPDPSIFHYALSLMELKPNEAIMVGDKLTTDILGANRTGIPSVWINRHGVHRSDEIIPRHEIKHLSELDAILNG
jgi:putative hydrolase of the HAD superfamily